MEDFIERVGESYLERKAFGVPQQLENLAKKQLTGGGEKEAKDKQSKGKSASIGDEKGESVSQASSGSSQKDKEIAKLKKELALLKLKNPKASFGTNASGPKRSSISRASNGQKTLTSKTAKGDKKTKEPAALGAVSGKHQDRKSKSGEKEASLSRLTKEANIVEISPTKRKASLSGYTEHNHDAKSEHGSGLMSEHGSHGKSTTSHTVAASEGKGRLSSASRSEHGGHAKSVASHAFAPSEGKRTASNASQSEHGGHARSTTSHTVAPSEDKRRSSIASQSEHGGHAKSATSHEIAPSEGKRRSSIASQSEHGGHAKSTTSHAVAPSEGKRRSSIASQSEHGGHAKSTTSHVVAPSEGKRRASNTSHSEHGSTAKSMAPVPVHKHLPVHAENLQEEGAMVEWRQLRRLSEEEPDLYAVEVEEEATGGLVEVETSQGKTLYRV